jgi:hypothetical protein
MSEGFNTSNTSTVTTCLDRVNLDVCTKGVDCIACNSVGDIVGLKISELQLNTGANKYVPKSKRVKEGENSSNENKLNLNLNAEEYVPKTNVEYEPELDADLCGEEFDMIVKDIIDNDAIEEEFEEEEESDEDKWFPKYKDCECCQGFVYKCEGIACANMDMCYCKMKEECDEENYN